MFYDQTPYEIKLEWGQRGRGPHLSAGISLSSLMNGRRMIERMMRNGSGEGRKR